MGLVADPLGVQSVFLRSLDAVPGRDSRFHTGLAASGVLPTSLIFVTVSDQAGASPASVIDQVLPSWWSGKNSKREPGNGQRAHHDFHRLAEKSISRRADRLVSHLPLKSLIYASVSAGRCPPSPSPSPSPSPGHHSVSVTSVRTARSWTCDARRVGVCRSAWLQRETKIGLLHPVRGSGAADVGRVDPSVFPSLESAHSLYTQFRTYPQPVHTTVMPPP